MQNSRILYSASILLLFEKKLAKYEIFAKFHKRFRSLETLARYHTGLPTKDETSDDCTEFIPSTSLNIWLSATVNFLKSLKRPRKTILKADLCEETISRTDEGQLRPKYIFNKCGTNIYFLYSTEVWSITITEFLNRLIKAWNSHILRVSGRLYGLILCG